MFLYQEMSCLATSKSNEGWVQLVSKKGKKNRKKTEGGNEISSLKLANDKALQESVKINVKPSDFKTNEDKHQPAHVAEKNNEASKLLSVGEANITEEIKLPKYREPKKIKKMINENIESDFNNSVHSLQPLPDLITNKSDHLVANELSSTYADAKKKKKHVEMALSGEDSLESSTTTTVSLLPDMVESASLTESKLKKKKNSDSLLMADKVLSSASSGPVSETVEGTIPSSQSIDNVINQQSSENKTSNVAFDELSATVVFIERRGWKLICCLTETLYSLKYHILLLEVPYENIFSTAGEIQIAIKI